MADDTALYQACGMPSTVSLLIKIRDLEFLRSCLQILMPGQPSQTSPQGASSSESEPIVTNGFIGGKHLR